MGFPPEETVDGGTVPAETTVTKVEHAAEDVADVAAPILESLILPEGAPAWLAEAFGVVRAAIESLHKRITSAGIE